jgi:hypothetical protein
MSLTIFSTAKPFTGRNALIQRNAIRSWTVLTPRPEVILLGSDGGTAEICAELGITHIPAVASRGGVPLVSDLFGQAQALASGDVLAYVNADIILTPSFMEMVRLVQAIGTPFLAVGRRIDLTQNDAVDFGSSRWADELTARARAQGVLMPPNWIDHFTFPRGLYKDIPDFAIGRTGWDNWLVWAAAAAGARVIDVTRFCPVIHQRHDYSHAGGAATVFAGEEARRARDLVGHWSHYHGVLHARWLLTAGGAVVPARSLPYRLARPRRAVAHALRFTVPLRRRLMDRRLSRALRQGAAQY